MPRASGDGRGASAQGIQDDPLCLAAKIRMLQVPRCHRGTHPQSGCEAPSTGWQRTNTQAMEGGAIAARLVIVQDISMRTYRFEDVETPSKPMYAPRNFALHRVRWRQVAGR